MTSTISVPRVIQKVYTLTKNDVAMHENFLPLEQVSGNLTIDIIDPTAPSDVLTVKLSGGKGSVLGYNEQLYSFVSGSSNCTYLGQNSDSEKAYSINVLNTDTNKSFSFRFYPDGKKVPYIRMLSGTTSNVNFTIKISYYQLL